MVKKKNIVKIPQQPWQQNAFKYGITFLIVVSSIWSASGLEITLERIIMIRTIRNWIKGNDDNNKWDDKKEWKNRERKEDEE